MPSVSGEGRGISEESSSPGRNLIERRGGMEERVWKAELGVSVEGREGTEGKEGGG